jgi:hypothetical protein
MPVKAVGQLLDVVYVKPEKFMIAPDAPPAESISRMRANGLAAPSRAVPPEHVAEATGQIGPGVCVCGLFSAGRRGVESPR